MRTRKDFWKAVPMIIFCTLLTSTSQVFLKIGSNKIAFDATILTNYYLIGGLFLYVISAVIMIYALKMSDLSSVYPFFSLSYIWVTLASAMLFADVISLPEYAGVAMIVIGVILVGRGATS